MTTTEQALHKKTVPPVHASKNELAKNSTAPAKTTPSSSTQLLLPSKFITHHPKAGINPLADAAAYLFSVAGKLKQLKSYRHLSKLHKELVQEINAFQDAAKAQGYSSEYILVSRYALCTTLDDIIVNTPWGGQGQWDNHNLLTAFNQEAFTQERFFMILDRITKDPGLYIDLMEFMYLCLSLGFKGSYRSTEYSNNQLEQITHSLYKHIRAHHGDFNKTLSPFPVRGATTHTKSTPRNTPVFLVALTTVTIILSLFVGLGYLLDTISNQAYRELMHIGKSILYETHDS
jgi:type VI secretion system protein ImpK